MGIFFDTHLAGIAKLAQAYVIRVRVEHGDPKVRLEQQTLEDHTERVRLAGSGLTADQRVPPETGGLKSCRQTVGNPAHRADLESRFVTPQAVQMGLHERGLGCTKPCRPERGRRPAEDLADLRHGADRAVPGDLRNLRPRVTGPDVDDLAEIRGAAVHIEADISADVQPGADGGGELKRMPVDGPSRAEFCHGIAVVLTNAPSGTCRGRIARCRSVSCRSSPGSDRTSSLA